MEQFNNAKRSGKSKHSTAMENQNDFLSQYMAKMEGEA